MEKTKIAFIGQKGIPAMGISAISGGIESYVQGIGERLCKKRYEVSVYVRGQCTKKSLKNYKGLKLIYIPTIKYKHLGPFLYIWRCLIHSIRFRNFDIIHYQGIGPSFFCGIHRLLDKKIVLTIHSLPQQSPKWNPFARLFLKISEFIGLYLAHKVIVVSRDLKEEYRRNVECISNAIPLECAYPEPSEIKKKYNLKGRDYLLYLGRIAPEKEIARLIEAFRKFRQDTEFLKKYNLENLKLVIAGVTESRDKYSRMIKDMVGNDSSIILTKWAKGQEKEELFTNARMFVLSSQSEGLPTALLEAMNHRLPPLISNMTSHKEVVEDGKDGFLFKQEPFADSFLSRLKETIILDEETLRRVGMKAQEKIQKEYCLDDRVEKIDKIYQSLHVDKGRNWQGCESIA